MKLNIANPATGQQKVFEVDDEKKLRLFYDKRISADISGDDLGTVQVTPQVNANVTGYVFRITGGFDKQGFPMMQGVLVPHRVRLLLNNNHQCYRARRTGERKRKSIRGCIVGPDIQILHLVVVAKGKENIEGLTDDNIPRRLGPKRASKIRKLFALEKADDVRKYVIRRELPAKEGKKKRTKAPKIQRLVTPRTQQRKRHMLAEKKARREHTRNQAAEYAKLLTERNKEARQALMSKRREVQSSKRQSEKKSATSTAKPAPKKK